MKIIRLEICESLRWLLFWIAALAALTTTVGMSTHYYGKRLQAAFDAGYEECHAPGAGILWVKKKS